MPEVLIGVLIIFVVLASYIMAYLIYIHSSMHGRSTWFWTVVACVPVLGPIVYFLYFSYKSMRLSPDHKQMRREKRGAQILKDTMIGKVSKYEALGILRSFRDPEIEDMIKARQIGEARKKIAAKQIKAASDGDSFALETYTLYVRLMERYGPAADIEPDLAELLEIPVKEMAEEVDDEEWGVSDFEEVTGYIDTGGYLAESALVPEDEYHSGEPEEEVLEVEAEIEDSSDDPDDERDDDGVELTS